MILENFLDNLILTRILEEDLQINLQRYPEEFAILKQLIEYGVIDKYNIASLQDCIFYCTIEYENFKNRDIMLALSTLFGSTKNDFIKKFSVEIVYDTICKLYVENLGNEQNLALEIKEEELRNCYEREHDKNKASIKIRLLQGNTLDRFITSVNLGISEREFRRIIAEIALELPIIAIPSKKGYRMAKTKEDLREAIHAFNDLNSRAKKLRQRKTKLLEFINFYK